MESVSVLSSNWTISPDWKKWKNFGNFFDAVAYESPRLIGKKENAVVLARVSRLLTKWLCNCTSIWMGTYFCLKHVYWEKVIFSSLKIDNPGRNRPMPQIWTLKSWINLQQHMIGFYPRFRTLFKFVVFCFRQFQFVAWFSLLFKVPLRRTRKLLHLTWWGGRKEK